jgi:hypothetical protein
MDWRHMLGNASFCATAAIGIDSLDAQCGQVAVFANAQAGRLLDPREIG